MSLLRALFGPSKAEIWSRLSGEIGAEHVPGGFWKGDKVVARSGPWTLTLDTYTVSTGKSSHTYTRLRAPFVNADAFRFTIYRRTLFSGLGSLLGMQDIEVGDADLDGAFVIQGNDERKVKTLLADGRIRELLAAQPGIHLQVADDEGWFGADFPEGVDELRFSTLGVVKDVERLKRLFELFSEVLHRLCHMGSAYEDDPGLSL